MSEGDLIYPSALLSPFFTYYLSKASDVLKIEWLENRGMQVGLVLREILC